MIKQDITYFINGQLLSIDGKTPAKLDHVKKGDDL